MFQVWLFGVSAPKHVGAVSSKEILRKILHALPSCECERQNINKHYTASKVLMIYKVLNHIKANRCSGDRNS